MTPTDIITTKSGLTVQVWQGDCLESLRAMPDESVHCCVTSPPYFGLRDYGTGTWEGGDPKCDHKPNHGKQGATGQRADRTFTAEAFAKAVCPKCGAIRVDKQIGLEDTPEQFIEKLVAVFREVRRVLREDGTCWVNMGDGYNGSGGVGGNGKQHTNQGSVDRPDNRAGWPGLKQKDLIGQPWMLAFALRADGWYLRQDIIWHKPNPMPESVRDRCTKAHEYIFLLTKSSKYFYDQEAILEPVSPNTNMRLSQNLAKQIGSERAHAGGKTNGNMKAVGRKAKLGKVGREKHNASFDAAVCLPVDQRNKRSVWTVTTRGYPEAHFATFPPKLIEPCIKAGCPQWCCPKCGTAVQGAQTPTEHAGSLPVLRDNNPSIERCSNCGEPITKETARPGVVLDPFGGSFTTAEVALQLGCNAVMCELNPEYIEMGKRRIAAEAAQGRLFT